MYGSTNYDNQANQLLAGNLKEKLLLGAEPPRAYEIAIESTRRNR